MTEEEEPAAPEQGAQFSVRRRRILEAVAWIFSPLLLIIVATIIASILGAPWLRASSIFAVLAIAVGGYLLYRPQRRFQFGQVRSASLVYTGVGALVLAAAFAFPSVRQPHASTDATDSQTSVRASTEVPLPAQRRQIYPWAYTVSQLTLACQNSTSFGVGEVMATADDGRVFAVSPSAVSEDRPSIESIQRSDGSRDEVNEGAVSLAQAGQGLCQGPNRASLTLILSAGDPPPPPPPPPSPWAYTSSVDEMSDQRTSHACTLSNNVVQLSFPYETQRVSLCLRQHPRWGQDVIVRLERGGQFLCTSYQACTVRIRFDDGEAAAYSALEPSDNSSDTIFISNDARFVGNVRRSSRVIIEANFYQAGAQRMSFDTEQLEWPPQ